MTPGLGIIWLHISFNLPKTMKHWNHWVRRLSHFGQLMSSIKTPWLYRLRGMTVMVGQPIKNPNNSDNLTCFYCTRGRDFNKYNIYTGHSVWSHGLHKINLFILISCGKRGFNQTFTSHVFRHFKNFCSNFFQCRTLHNTHSRKSHIFSFFLTQETSFSLHYLISRILYDIL